MRFCRITAIAMLLLGASTALAQFKEGGTDGTTLGEAQTTRWRLGLTIKAANAPCHGVGYMSVPMEWPEQEVSIIEEDVSPEIKINYKTIESGVRVMNIKVGQLAAGEEAKAIVTFEVRRSGIMPPEETDGFVIPDSKDMSKEIRQYLAPSPKIESRDARIRELAKTVGADKEKAWDRVEAIYDWVREHVKYENGPLKGAVAALKDGKGDCEELTSLFIAICRASGIPARTVWVEGHCYPEFYLEDEKGEGHWFPCQAAGSREFGGITEVRPIWQKGDNVRPPVNSKERRRYLDFDLTITGTSRPTVRSIREAVSN